MRNLKNRCYLTATISNLLTNNNSSLEVYDELKKNHIQLAYRFGPYMENLGAQSAFGNNSTRDNSLFKWTDYALFQILIFIEELY